MALNAGDSFSDWDIFPLQAIISPFKTILRLRYFLIFWDREGRISLPPPQLNSGISGLNHKQTSKRRAYSVGVMIPYYWETTSWSPSSRHFGYNQNITKKVLNNGQRFDWFCSKWFLTCYLLSPPTLPPSLAVYTQEFHEKTWKPKHNNSKNNSRLPATWTEIFLACLSNPLPVIVRIVPPAMLPTEGLASSTSAQYK